MKRYRYRAYPTPGQQVSLARTFGSARVVYNDFITERNRLRESDLHREVSFGDTAKKVITQAKLTPSRAWLSEVSNIALQQSVRQAERAYRNWFDSLAGKRKRKVGAPRFRRRSARQSITLTRGGFSVRETTHGVAHVRLAKVGWVRFNLSRPLPSVPSSVTVIGNPDGTYEVSFVVEADPVSPDASTRAVGIDLGLIDFAAVVASDGTREKIANPRHYRAHERKLARAQKKLSRTQRGSKNRIKARKRVAKVHSQIAHARVDFTRKLARRIVDENQVIAVETLAVSKLARTRLAKSVHDAGWGTFLLTLRQMADEAGRTVVAVPRTFPSSQICSVCGVNDGKKSLSVRSWTCSCGANLDRDYNAAVNIMVAGGLSETENACGADVRLRLAGAVSDESGTHRTDSTLCVGRSRNPRP